MYGLINALDPKEYIISNENQKWPNGLVFKIKELHNSKIAYQGILLNGTDKNKCFKYETNSKTYCNCNNTCIECKHLKSEIKPTILIESNQISKSKRCSTLIYPAYSFDSNLKLGSLI